MGHCRRWREIEEEVEAAEDICEKEAVESERDSFCNSRCFLIIWRDRYGRRRCKCCRGGCNS